MRTTDDQPVVFVFNNHCGAIPDDRRGTGDVKQIYSSKINRSKTVKKFHVNAYFGFLPVYLLLLSSVRNVSVFFFITYEIVR